MSQEEYTELNAHVDAVTAQDVHLGRVLALMASYLPGYSEAEQAAADAAKAEAAAAAPAPAEPFQAPVESEQANAS